MICRAAQYAEAIQGLKIAKDVADRNFETGPSGFEDASLSIDGGAFRMSVDSQGRLSIGFNRAMPAGIVPAFIDWLRSWYEEPRPEGVPKQVHVDHTGEL